MKRSWCRLGVAVSGVALLASGLGGVVPAQATTPAAKKKVKQPVIEAFGWDRYSVSDPEPYGGCTGWLAVVRNPNKKALLNVVSIRVTARDENGRILGTEEDVMTLGLPPQRSVAREDFLCTQGEKPPATMTVSVIPNERSDFVATKAKPRAFKPFPTTNVGWFITPDGVEMSGEVTNLFTRPQDVEVVVALQDTAGNIIGGGTATLKGLRRKDPTPFFIEDNWTWLDGVPVTAKAYASPNGYPNPYEKVASSK